MFVAGSESLDILQKIQYGDDRLLDWARNSHWSDGKTARQACMELFEDVHAFTSGNEQNDDITIMTIKYK